MTRTTPDWWVQQESRSEESHKPVCDMEACVKCGLRMSYQVKGSGNGEHRHMGPHPNQVMVAMEQLRTHHTAENITEKMVNGKLMELKGIQLQQGLSNSMAINMSLRGYRRRRGLDQTDQGSNGYTMPKGQTDLLMEAAEKYLREKGLDGLDPEEFKERVMNHVLGKMQVKKEPKPEINDPKAAEAMVLEIISSDEENTKDTAQAGSNKR